MLRAALYMRVSTEDQLEFSIDAQKRALIEYAKKNEMAVDDRYIFVDEGISGTSAKKRPEFQRMIATAKKKPKRFDVILVHKFDRFARSREDSILYKSLLKKECDIQVISITEHIEDGRIGVILESMLEGMAEYYSLNLSEEVTKGMSEKARRGGAQSEAPYGYRRIKDTYIVVQDEAEVVKMIFSKFASGELGYGELCRTLMASGITNKKGGPITVYGLKYMLENPVYTGKVRWNYTSHKNKRRKNPREEWILVDGSHDAIIDDDTFNAVQDRIYSLKRTDYHYTPNKDVSHWLSGILRCASCGKVLVYNKGNSKSRNKKPYFRCNGYNKSVCSESNMMPVYRYEEEVKKALEQQMLILSTTDGSATIKIEKSKQDDMTRTLLEKQLEKTRKKLENAKKAYLAEIDTLEEYAQNKEMIMNEEKQILEKLSLEVDDQSASKEIATKIAHTLQLLEDENVDKKTMNELLKTFISKIEVDKKNDKMYIKLFV